MALKRQSVGELRQVLAGGGGGGALVAGVEEEEGSLRLRLQLDTAAYKDAVAFPRPFCAFCALKRHSLHSVHTLLHTLSAPLHGTVCLAWHICEPQQTHKHVHCTAAGGAAARAQAPDQRAAAANAEGAAAARG